jgi:hypothetical protein
VAKDTLTIKLHIEADFQTIQAIRQALSAQTARQALGCAVATQFQAALRPHQLGPVQLTPQLLVSRYRETNRVTYPPPILQDGLLTPWDYELDQKIGTIGLDEPYWLNWLQEEFTTSFRYQAGPASFTAIKEIRRGRPVWYAHKRLRGTLKRFYLGKSENLTPQKLADTARKFSQWRSVSLTPETASAAKP